MRHPSIYFACALAGAVLAAGIPVQAQEAENPSDSGVALAFRVEGVTPDNVQAVSECLKQRNPDIQAIEPRPDGALVVRVPASGTVKLAQLEMSLVELAQASAGMEVSLDRGSVEITSRCLVVYDGVTTRELHDSLLARLGEVEGLVVASASPGALGRFVVEPRPAGPSTADEPPAPATLRPFLEAAQALSAGSPDGPSITLMNAFWTAHSVD